MWVGGGGVVGSTGGVGAGGRVGVGNSAGYNICGSTKSEQTNQAQPIDERTEATPGLHTRNARHTMPHRPTVHRAKTDKKREPARDTPECRKLFLLVKIPHTPCFTYYRGLTPICCVLRRCCPDPTAPHTSHVPEPDPPPTPPPASPLTD